MITSPQRIDLLRTTGRVTMVALLGYIYDCDVDPDALNWQVETDGNIKKVVLTPIAESQYYGKTNFSYEAIGIELAGYANFQFVLATDLPITVGDVRDIIEDKYGLIFDRRDLGFSDTDVVASEYGDIAWDIHSESLRFGAGQLQLSIVPKSTLDLAALIPPTSGQALTSVGDVIPPTA